MLAINKPISARIVCRPEEKESQHQLPGVLPEQISGGGQSHLSRFESQAAFCLRV
jgi:hypothetical protein